MSVKKFLTYFTMYKKHNIQQYSVEQKYTVQYYRLFCT